MKSPIFTGTVLMMVTGEISKRDYFRLSFTTVCFMTSMTTRVLKSTRFIHLGRYYGHVDIFTVLLHFILI